MASLNFTAKITLGAIFLESTHISLFKFLQADAATDNDEDPVIRIAFVQLKIKFEKSDAKFQFQNNRHHV